MKNKHSAGILLYRLINTKTEFFLVHMGGPFWVNKDLGAWSVPKGEYEENEHSLDAAKREFQEETGFSIDMNKSFIELAPVKQKSGKIISIFAVEGDCDPSQIKSNTFSVEWPPRSGQMKKFPEVDRAGWFTYEEARQKIILGQIGFLDELIELIKRTTN